MGVRNTGNGAGRGRFGRRAAARVLAPAMAVVLAGTGVAHALGGVESAHWLRAWGYAVPPGHPAPGDALTYDEELVPAGARIQVVQRVSGGAMTVELEVRGVLPGHAFGAHVHQLPCGDDPADSGPHYQNDPEAEPEPANPHNEVWLDFTADSAGRGTALSRQPWVFRPGEANSLVIHEHATGHGGDAGGRVACLTVGFTD
ncbi:superoxide dismutase family protein [Streptomyces harbinensis]|uniref:superoxide dismutase family protein n=1 Tax=Streptomyces harbinensis TaxID=1176198 RepID=UPI003390D91B